jgi:hypothetical protein
MDTLEKAICLQQRFAPAHNWELTTSEVQQLIGVKPIVRKEKIPIKEVHLSLLKLGESVIKLHGE